MMNLRTKILFLFLFASPISSFACGYGEQRTSYLRNSINYVGCAPIPGYYELSAQGFADRARSMGDAMKGAISGVAGFGEQLQENQRFLNRPEIKKLLRGYWMYGREDEGQINRKVTYEESCAALFIRANGLKTDGFMQISGFGGSAKGAMLIFSGAEIPRPTSPNKVKVTLTQLNEKPQTVQALNYSQPANNWGVIVLEMPTLEAALESMEDEKTIGVSMNEKLLVEIKWHGGIAARDRLQQCENNRVAQANGRK
jgi:hypothetical protein